MFKNILTFFIVIFMFHFVFATSIAAKEKIILESSREILIRTYLDIIENNMIENKQAIESRIKLNNKIIFNKDISLTINAEGRSENLLKGVSEESIDLYLREAFIKSHHENFDISIGQQKITWGKLDDLIVLDRMTPQDLKWFALYDKQERKIPTLMLKHQYHAENWQLESIFLPFFTPSEVDFFGTDWAVFGRLKEGILRDSFSESTKTTIRNIHIEDKDNITDKSFKNNQLGLRLRSHFKEVDYSLYYMYLRHSIPTLREKTSAGNTLKQFLYDPTLENLTTLIDSNPSDADLTLEKEYPRINIIGLDWETVLGSFGLRGEGGVFFNTPYLRTDLSYVTKDTFSVGIGIDHTTDQNVYFNFQLIGNYIFDYEELFAEEKFTQQIAGTTSKDFLNGNLILNMDWGWNLSHGDVMFNPEITYKFQNNIDLGLGAFIFEGATQTVFGRYDTKDTAYIEMNYKF